MKEKDPIIAMIQQLAEMVNMIEKNREGKSDEPLPDNIEDMLGELEGQVALFREVTEETLDELGIDRVELMRRIKNPPDTLKPSDKKSLEQLSHLKQNMSEIQNEISRKAIGEKRLPTAGKKKGKRKKSRREKFKRLGGDDKWKPV